jgi:processive 1,2-diacylglycerol beta-glucosyltransferase
LTASFGDGHNTAARSVAAAFDQRGVANEGATDLLERIQPDAMRVISAAYRSVIVRWPKIWQALYGIADRMPFGEDAPDTTPKITRGVANFLQESSPDIVVSTYLLYGHVIQRLFGSGPLPFTLLTMVTDSSTINRSWLHGADGHYAVTDEASAAYFLERGIPSDRVHVTGFPVNPDFETKAPPAPESEIPTPLRVLYTPSNNNAAVRRTLRSIVAADLPIALTMVLGRGEARLRELASFEAPEGTEIIGWTDRMPELLKSHHLLIGKAGGASVQESLAARCPMLVNYIVPGQEEGNAELISRLGAGKVVRNPEAIGAAIAELLLQTGANWLAMRRAAFEHGRPRAAGTVAELAMKLARESEQFGN